MGLGAFGGLLLGLTESVAFAVELDDFRAMDEAVDKSDDAGGGGEHLGPLREGFIGRDEDGRSEVPARDDLVRFCDDGRYGIDTNPIENAIRPFCVGRRNWLFADTVAGANANASARLYSLIECANANGLDPYAYLRHVFTALPKAQSLAEVEALLPTRLDPAALAQDPLQESFLAARQ